MFKYNAVNPLNANDVLKAAVNVVAQPAPGGGAGAGGAGGAGGGAGLGPTTANPGGLAIPPGVTPVQSATVKITATALDPGVVHLLAGGKVTWQNTTNLPVKLGAVGMASGLFATLVPAGGTYTFVFTHPFAVMYEITGGIQGKVNVY
jgi:hypothetical protein